MLRYKSSEKVITVLSPSSTAFADYYLRLSAAHPIQSKIFNIRANINHNVYNADFLYNLTIPCDGVVATSASIFMTPYQKTQYILSEFGNYNV